MEVGDRVRRTGEAARSVEVAAWRTDGFGGRRALQNPGIENSSSCDVDVDPTPVALEIVTPFKPECDKQKDGFLAGPTVQISIEFDSL